MWMLGVVLVLVFMSPIFGGRDHRVPWKTQCISNLKQVSIGLALYQEGNDQTFPPFAHSIDLSRGSKRPLGGQESTQWWSLLSNYLTDTRRLTCPSHRQENHGSRLSPAKVSYLMNRALESLPDSQISRPEEVVIFVEARVPRASAWFEPPRDLFWGTYSVLGISNHRPSGLHVAFADTSVKRLDVDYLRSDPCGSPWSGVEYMRRFPIPEVPARPPLFTRTCPK